MKVIQSIPAEEKYFQEFDVEVGNVWFGTEGNIVNVFDEIKYQEMLGFGGALTESSAYNYSLLSKDDKNEFLKAYFDRKDGIGYNFGRLHINSCDFSLSIYADVEEGDMTLETFNIERDKKYIIPFAKDVVEYTKEGIMLFASPWSPPAYMKDNNNMLGGGKLKEEFKELWALFYAKFIKAYREEGVNISAITVQNEPKAVQTWESCEYTAEDERDFLDEYLIPVLEKEGLSDIKIIIWDHNKERVYDRAKTILENKKVNERVWAVGHHWYSGDHFEGLSLVEENLKKPNICTEFCASFGMIKDVKKLAERYGREICENINNYCIGICDWNLFMDEFGGPYHNRGKAGTSALKLDYTNGGAGCYSPIMFNSETKKLNMTPVYYYVGHFSKYVKRGAVRVATTKFSKDIYTCAFVNPDGEKVVFLMNTLDEEVSVNLRYNGECTAIMLPAHSASTALF